MKSGTFKKMWEFQKTWTVMLRAGICHQTELSSICSPLLCNFGQQYKLSNLGFMNCKMGIINDTPLQVGQDLNSHRHLLVVRILVSIM